jgi:Na+/melibiose symporter-like transporter
MINVKNFGLKYYSDEAIAKTSLVTMPASFVISPCIGLLIDKFGVQIVYRIIAGVTIVNVLVFYLFMDNIWVLYLCVTLFYASFLSMITLITVSTSFIYDHEVGKRLQKYMHCAVSVSGIYTVLINDNTVLQIFG